MQVCFFVLHQDNVATVQGRVEFFLARAFRLVWLAFALIALLEDNHETLQWIRVETATYLILFINALEIVVSFKDARSVTVHLVEAILRFFLPSFGREILFCTRSRLQVSPTDIVKAVLPGFHHKFQLADLRPNILAWVADDSRRGGELRAFDYKTPIILCLNGWFLQRVLSPRHYIEQIADDND